MISAGYFTHCFRILWSLSIVSALRLVWKKMKGQHGTVSGFSDIVINRKWKQKHAFNYDSPQNWGLSAANALSDVFSNLAALVFVNLDNYFTITVKLFSGCILFSQSLLCRLNRGRKGQFDTSIWVDKGVKVSLVSTVHHLDAKSIFLHWQLFKRKATYTQPGQKMSLFGFK